MKSSWFLFLCLMACRSHPVQKQGRLFPYGLYKEEVILLKDHKEKRFPAQTVWSKEKFSLNVSDQDQHRLIEFNENLKAYKKSIFVDQQRVPLTEDQAMFYFSYLKFIYSLDLSICENPEKICKTQFMGSDFVFERDQSGLVQTIHMQRGERKMRVKVLSFDPENN